MKITKNQFISHRQGSWRWQKRFALVRYVMEYSKKKGFIWKKLETINNKIKPNQVGANYGGLHNMSVDDDVIPYNNDDH